MSKTGEKVCPSLRKSKFALSSTSCSIQTLSGLDDAHPHSGMQSAESTESNANLIWKHPH